MRFAIVVFLIPLVFAACQSERLLVDNVKSVRIEPDRNATINVGNTFHYTLFAEMVSGETRKVKNDALVQFPDGKLEDKGQHLAAINPPLPNFETTFLPVEIGLKIGDYEFSNVDTLSLNFKGSISARWRGNDGKNGSQPRASSSTLFGRDGLDGRPGENGSNGEDGKHFTGYLWEMNKELRLVLICDSTGTKYCYKTIQRDSILIDLRGGNAGDGSMGGDGGNGKDEKPTKTAGNGGNGGIGGSGGKGGDGGSLLLFIHPSAAYMDHSISVLNSGGKGGAAGIGGTSGNAGKSLNGSKKATSGKTGVNGEPGMDGDDGPPITISKVAFDYSVFE